MPQNKEAHFFRGTATGNNNKKGAIMIIGRFLANSDEVMFWGEVAFIDYPVHILPPKHDKAGGPDFIVTAKGIEGPLDYGAAWWRQDAENGERYLAITLDSPAWPGPIRARLLSNHDEEHTFSLIWHRTPRRGVSPA
jgi:uncharacterized protein (DUF736 family)